MNEMTEQTPPEPESLDNEIVAEEEEKIFAPQNELPFPEQEIDLNEIFPEEENDLNELFPDEETKVLLKKIQRNKKDLHTMTDRFVDDNWTGDGPVMDEQAGTNEPQASTDEGGVNPTY
jgi:hypothetical protein